MREKDIEGFPGYKITDEGQVYSYKSGKAKLLKMRKHRGGYLLAHLCKNGKHYNKTVHRLVAEHFIENPFCLPQVNHRDGKKDHNHWTNLEWCTQLENNIHALNTGLRPKIGKITQEIADKIRTKWKTGLFTHQQLGDEFGVTRSQIGNIVNYKQWAA